MFPNNEYMETVRAWLAANAQNARLARTSHYQWASRWLARYDRERQRARRLRRERIAAVWLMALALGAWLWRLL